MWLRKMERLTLLFKMLPEVHSWAGCGRGDLAMCKLALSCPVQNKAETYLVWLRSWRSRKKVKETWFSHPAEVINCGEFPENKGSDTFFYFSKISWQIRNCVMLHIYAPRPHSERTLSGTAVGCFYVLSCTRMALSRETAIHFLRQKPIFMTLSRQVFSDLCLYSYIHTRYQLRLELLTAAFIYNPAPETLLS